VAGRSGGHADCFCVAAVPDALLLLLLLAEELILMLIKERAGRNSESPLKLFVVQVSSRFISTEKENWD